MSTTNHVQSGEHHHAHHFKSADHEFEASKQGMWLFLVTEVLMIGAVFVGYAIFRAWYPDMFSAAHKMLSVKMGATNTVILITSSLTMVLAVTASQMGDRKKTFWYLFATFLFGCGFLVVKYFEYSAKIHHGLLPGGFYHYIPEHGGLELPHPKTPLFFSFYFVLTGIHAAHVIIGMGLMAWLMRRNAKGEFSAKFYTPVELVGFYWHFVDLVWIYLFPLLYLVG